MFYLYRFKNINDEVIYVGKTNNIDKRLYYHFSERGHLPIECYNETEKIEVLEVKTKTEMNIKELYYISKFKCKYNSLNNDEPVFFKELECNDVWNEYNLNESEENYKDKKIMELTLENGKLKNKLKEKNEREERVIKEYTAYSQEYYLLLDVVKIYEEKTGYKWKRKGYKIILY